MTAARRAGLLAAASLIAVPVAVPVAGPAQAATKATMRVFDATLSEGTGGQAVVAFAVQLSAPAKQTVAFTWGTRPGTATAGQDYTAVPPGTAASIPKGQTATVLIVRVAADSVDEYTETFGVRLAAVPSSVIVADADGTATIRDDDAPPLLAVSPAQVVEGADAVTPTRRSLTAVLSQPSGKPVSVRYTVAGGTAVVGTDVEARTATVSFAPGQTTGALTVDVYGDAEDEPNRTFALAWAGPSNLQLPGRRTTITLLDDDGPLRPSILGSTPAGPSPDPTPEVYGLAPAGSTVEVFLNGSCTGAPVAVGSAAAFTGAGVEIPVQENRANTLTVKATDTVGGEDSACSGSYGYVHDDIAPDAPSGLAVDPASPTQDPEPVLRGTAEDGSSVSVFVDTACTGVAAETLDAAAFAGSGSTLLGLTPNVTHQVRAAATDAAGNVSGCSAPLLVLVDTLPPAAPTGLQVVDGLPAGDDVVVGGSAEPGSTVGVFIDNPCTDAADNLGSAASFAGAGIPVSHPLAEGVHTVYARATDAAGNRGACSAGLSLLVDRTAPAAPSALQLVGDTPTDQPQAQVRGTAEPGSTVRVFRSTGGGSGCDVEVGSGSAVVFAGVGGIQLTGLVEGANELRARAYDSVGNASGCSADAVTVVVDTTAPAAPVGLTVVGGSPTTDPTPAISGSAEPGSQVHLWVGDPVCAGTAQATGTATELAIGITLVDPLPDGTYLVTATATDAAGNESGCSDPVTVTVAQAPGPLPWGAAAGRPSHA